MAGFVKIYGDRLLSSTLWLEPLEVRFVFIGMLALADVDGFVPIPSIEVLAFRLNVDLIIVEKALSVLESEDTSSRSSEENGKRVVRVDGGWNIVTYQKYREMRTERQENVRRATEVWRERRRCSPVNTGDTEADQEAEAEAEPERGRISTPTNPSSRSARSKHSEAVERVWARHEELRKQLKPGARTMKCAPGRRRAIAARIQEHGEQACMDVLAVYAREARDSREGPRWLNGVTPFRPDNFTRALASAESDSSEPVVARVQWGE